jgi:hypothetical protein
MSQTAQRLFADIRELAPHVTSRAVEIETGRRIPPDLVDALRSIGVFRCSCLRVMAGSNSICQQRWRSSGRSAD